LYYVLAEVKCATVLVDWPSCQSFGQINIFRTARFCWGPVFNSDWLSVFACWGNWGL